MPLIVPRGKTQKEGTCKVPATIVTYVIVINGWQDMDGQAN